MAAPSEQLKQLFDEDYYNEVADNPEFGSQSGEHDLLLTERCPNKLQDVSPQAYEKRGLYSTDMINRVKKLLSDNVGAFSSDELWLAEVFIKQHEDVVDAIKNCKMFLIPINGIGAGCVTYSFIESIEWMRFQSAEDYQLFLDRLIACPVQVDQFIEAFREGVRQNIIASFPMTRNVVEQLQANIDGGLPELTAPVREAAYQNLPNDLKEKIIASIEGVRQSFIKFKEFFVTEYLPVIRQDAGCASLPNGVAIYQTCLR